jgi:hypothetical protein
VRDALDHQFQFPLDYIDNLFVRVAVFGQQGAFFDLNVQHGHVLGCNGVSLDALGNLKLRQFA